MTSSRTMGEETPSAIDWAEHGRRDHGTALPLADLVPSWLFWVLGIALLLPVWTGAHFPSEDGLAHLAWTEVYRSLAAADSPWRDHYLRSAHWNTPNLTYFALQYGLGSALDPHLAQRVAISILILCWVAAVAGLSRALSGKLTIGALASLLLIHGSWLYGGYLSFLTGVPILLTSLALVIGILRRDGQVRPARWIVLALLGVASYYSHLVVAGMYLVLVAVSVGALVALRRRGALVRGLAVTALPTILLVLSYAATSTLGDGGMRWEPATKTVARFAGFAFFRGFAAPGPAFWTALSLFALIVLVLCIDAVRALLRRRVPYTGTVVIALAGCLTILYFIAPDGVGDGYNLKGRFQLVLWAWFLPSVPYRLSRRVGVAICAGVSILLGWQIVAFTVRASRFNAAYDSVVARASSIPPGATVERVLDYDHAGFDGSFIRVLAHAPEDLTYHCRCVLVDGYHPSTAFYWVAARNAGTERARFRLQVQQRPESPVTIAIDDLGDGPGEIGAGHAAKDAAGSGARP